MNQKLKAAFQLASVLSAAYGLRASLREAKACLLYTSDAADE